MLLQHPPSRLKVSSRLSRLDSVCTKLLPPAAKTRTASSSNHTENRLTTKPQDFCHETNPKVCIKQRKKAVQTVALQPPPCSTCCIDLCIDSVHLWTIIRHHRTVNCVLVFLVKYCHVTRFHLKMCLQFRVGTSSAVAQGVKAQTRLRMRPNRINIY